MALTRGDLVLLMRREIELALVVDPPTGGWFRAGTADGKVRRFPSELVVFPALGRLEPPEDGGEMQSVVVAARESLARRSAAYDLTTLRDCALLDDHPLGLDELAELFFDGDPDGDDRGALLFGLLDTESPFERVDECFRPFDDEEIEARAAAFEREAIEREERARRAKETRERRREEASVALPEIRRLLANRIRASELSHETVEWLDAFRHELIHDPTLLSGGSVACGGEAIKIQDENHAVQLLHRGGKWNPDDEDLRALRANLGKPFPDAVVEAADAIVPTDEPAEDLTDLPTFTVDSSDTEDLDDAITIEPDGDTFRIAIHVADVTRVIPVDGPLDAWAFDRGESIYLPTRTHHLFPRGVMERVSLDPGQTRTAVTLRFVLTADGEVASPTFARTRIRSDERLDYEEVDRRIHDGAAWSSWAALVTRLQARRTRRGAEVPMLPDVRIVIEEGEIEVRVMPTDTPSHRLVSELMILFNECTALYFREKGVPAIFKTQPAAAVPVEYPVDSDPLYFPRIIRVLRASVAGLDPAPHAFLGVEAYCQSTSPIRRYSDLVHQRQLVATLAGDALPYDGEALQRIYPHLETRGAEIRGLERRRRRYWILKKLKSYRGKRLQGIVSQIRPGGRPVVFFPELLLDTPVMLPTYLNYEIGDAIYLSPRKVDPIRGGVWAEPGASA